MTRRRITGSGVWIFSRSERSLDGIRFGGRAQIFPEGRRRAAKTALPREAQKNRGDLKQERLLAGINDEA